MLITKLLLELTCGVDCNGISPVCPCREFCLWVLLKTLENCFESVSLELGVLIVVLGVNLLEGGELHVLKVKASSTCLN